MENPTPASREIDSTGQELFADAMEKTIALHSAYDVLEDYSEFMFSHPDYERVILRREVIRMPGMPVTTGYTLITSSLSSTKRDNSLETVENFYVEKPNAANLMVQPTSFYSKEQYSGDDIENGTQANAVVQQTEFDPLFGRFLELGEELDHTTDPSRREELTQEMAELSAERTRSINIGVELGIQDDNVFTPELLQKAFNILLTAQPAEFELPDMPFGELSDFDSAVEDAANIAEDRLPYIEQIARHLGQMQVNRAHKRQ